MTKTPALTPWVGSEPPTQTMLWKLMVAEGLDPYGWSNEPLYTYIAHTHPRHKVLYVVQGSITFGLPELNQEVTMKAGDRLDLPADTLHDAHVGAQGVVCLEGYK
jgi:uncharacterized protein YjlB